ncbi:MAG TPA: TraB/GumN family protein [Chlorobiota bacterium]|nr:TraB/GumN family protein [Chlorobiota bacterium]
MKRFLAVVMMMGIVGLALPCHAYDTTARSLLWKITSKGGAVSHVFGTIHVADTMVLRHRDTVLQLLDASRLALMELDLDSMMTSVSPTRLLLPKGTTLASMFTEEEWKEISVYLEEKLGPMARMATMMKPAGVVALLMFQEVESTAEWSVDQFMWNRCAAKDIPRRGLETVEEQLTILETLPPSVLLDVVRSSDTTTTTMSDLLHAYAQEDLPKILTSSSELSKWPEFERAINAERNATMIQRAQPHLERGGVFIAIGALHLPGVAGILARLESAGYTVEPVLGSSRIAWWTLHD